MTREEMALSTSDNLFQNQDINCAILFDRRDSTPMTAAIIEKLLIFKIKPNTNNPVQMVRMISYFIFLSIRF